MMEQRTRHNWQRFDDWREPGNNPLTNPDLRSSGTNGPGGMVWEAWDMLASRVPLLTDEVDESGWSLKKKAARLESHWWDAQEWMISTFNARQAAYARREAEGGKALPPDQLVIEGEFRQRVWGFWRSPAFRFVNAADYADVSIEKVVLSGRSGYVRLFGSGLAGRYIMLNGEHFGPFEQHERRADRFDALMTPAERRKVAAGSGLGALS